MTLTQINKAGLDELALDHVFTIGASGTDHYTFQGEGLNGTVNDPTLYLTRGRTYRFENGTGAHPIRIQSTSGASGTAYNTGVTNNAGSGTVIVEVQHDAPDVLYYQCTSHANMGGTIYITGALSDGSVTSAKIADGAIVNADVNASAAIAGTKIDPSFTSNITITNSGPKIELVDSGDNPDYHIENANGALKIRDTTNSTNRLVVNTDGHVDIGANLDCEAGVDVTGNITVTGTVDGVDIAALNSTVSGLSSTTINNNANNRVITGSGTANTLEGESGLTFDSSNNVLSAGSGLGIQNVSGVIAGSGGGNDYLTIRDSGNNDRLVVRTHGTNNGKVGIGTNNPDDTLDVVGTMQVSSNAYFSNQYVSGSIFLGGTGSANEFSDYEEGTFTPTIYQGITNPSLSEAEGTYTKIGNVVKFNFFIRVGSGGGYSNNSQFKFGGLPFTQDNTSGRRGFGLLTYSNAHGLTHETGHHLYIYGGIAELWSGLHGVNGASTSNQQYRYFIGGGHYYV